MVTWILYIYLYPSPSFPACTGWFVFLRDSTVASQCHMFVVVAIFTSNFDSCNHVVPSRQRYQRQLALRLVHASSWPLLTSALQRAFSYVVSAWTSKRPTFMSAELMRVASRFSTSALRFGLLPNVQGEGSVVVDARRQDLLEQTPAGRRIGKIELSAQSPPTVQASDPVGAPHVQGVGAQLR